MNTCRYCGEPLHRDENEEACPFNPDAEGEEADR